MRIGRSAPCLSLGLAVALVGLTGCGNSDGDTTVERAQLRVRAAEQDVAKAETAFATASSEFCGAAKTYIVAIDRYGDVLTSTEVTVGDVKDAGSDLSDPREEALSGAEAAVAANEDLFTAQAELAEAKADLKQAKAGTTASPEASGGDKATASPTPLAPAGTVDRIKSAEASLEAAQKGVTDQTPLAQASLQFNSAAVALEMAWLRLFSDAGCLTDQQEQADEAVRAYTMGIQQVLAEAGRYTGEVDGVYGPETVAAIEELQKANGLPATGAVDKATAAALQSEQLAQGGAAAQEAMVTTAAVQQTLKLAGFWDGPVDGTWTPALTDALKEFQRALGVKPTGSVDAATVAALEKAIAAAAEPDSTPSGTPSTPTATETPSPTSP